MIAISGGVSGYNAIENSKAGGASVAVAIDTATPVPRIVVRQGAVRYRRGRLLIQDSTAIGKRNRAGADRESLYCNDMARHNMEDAEVP